MSWLMGVRECVNIQDVNRKQYPRFYVRNKTPRSPSECLSPKKKISSKNPLQQQLLFPYSAALRPYPEEQMSHHSNTRSIQGNKLY